MKSILSIGIACILLGCANPKTITFKSHQIPQILEPIDIYTLDNGHGLIVRITPLGGMVLSIKTLDRYGSSDDIVLGYPSINEYLTNDYHFGILGRYADRIAGAKCKVGELEYELSDNDFGNTLDGGKNGFNAVIWDAHSYTNGRAEPTLELKYTSPDGENGFPGNLAVVVRYALTKDNGLKITFDAGCDKETVVNLANQMWFNLGHIGDRDVLDHQALFMAETFLPVDQNLIPSGEMRNVLNTPFDFTKFKPIRKDILVENLQLLNGAGYDHTWVLDKTADEFILAAKVYEPIFGRYLEVWTTQPGLHFETGNHFVSSTKGKENRVHRKHFGFTIRPQSFPNGPNMTEFPSVVLKPGERYQETTIYKFSAKKQLALPFITNIGDN